jgi:hypothetical protein
MDFLNHREGGKDVCQVFFFSSSQCTIRLNSRNCKRLGEFEEIEISRQSCTGETVNSKEENICLDYVQEYNLCTC